MQEITCKGCGKVFHRQPQRGRKPTQCDGCRSGATVSAFAPPLPGQAELALAPQAPGPLPVFDFSDVFKPATEAHTPMVAVYWGDAPAENPGHTWEGFKPVPTVPTSLLAQPGKLPRTHYRIVSGGGVMFAPGVFGSEGEARTQCDRLNLEEGAAIDPYAVAKIEILS